MRNILFDATRTKYPHTGLYHFCVQLGLALKENLGADEWQRRLTFFVPPENRALFGMGAPYQSLHALHKLWMPFARNYDLWHATYQSTKYLPSRGPEVVLTIHDLNFLIEKKSLRKKNKYLRQVQRNINRASAVVAISNYVKNDIEAHLDLKGKKVEVIYNGSNINPHTQAKKPHGLPLDKPFFYTIGTIVQKKNFHVLPALLLENDFQLVISGTVQSETYKESIIQEAKRLNVLDRLFFTWPVAESEKYWLLQNCALFCFPSVAEGFGLLAVRAGSAGSAHWCCSGC